MSPNAEAVTYAILDILAKPIFGLWLLIGYQRMAERYFAPSLSSVTTVSKRWLTNCLVLFILEDGGLRDSGLVRVLSGLVMTKTKLALTSNMTWFMGIKLESER